MSDYYRDSAGPLFELAASINSRHNVAARTSDPATSHKAAARATTFRGDHARRIVAALELGPAGQTEIAARAGMTVAQVSKRLKELREAGAIERTGREVAGRESEYRLIFETRLEGDPE